MLKKGPAEVHTTEHLLSALYALGVNNAEVEVHGQELPGLDGSAKEYAEAIERAGIIEQDTPVKELLIDKEVGVTRNDAFLTAFPYKDFRISYFLSYPVKSIGEQFLSIDISAETFKKEIAPARTFCMAREAFLLKLFGFGKGANNKNTLVMGKAGPIGNNLRFPDEPVRHKILDLIGDLSLTGMPIKAHIVAVKSGHSLNLELVNKLKGEYHG
jgi:UDP-3-O-[3-hydroxymyristoyl] N-acetylglucosamine deacetylase/3-hydroxyacyl-[acyl-carrier-protein] dehydratase